MKRWQSFLMIVLLLAGISTARAQEPKETKTEKQTPATDESKNTRAETVPPSFYNLVFTLTELEDGKKLNSREYQTMASLNDFSRLRIGTRVPIDTGRGNITYMDVGLNLDARPRLLGGNLVLDFTADISSFAIPEQAEGKAQNPVTRNVRSQVQALVIPGKPTLLSSIDDPSSRKQYQIEVTVTKLR